MSIGWITLFYFSTLFILMAAGLPLVFALGGISVLFMLICWGVPSVFVITASTWALMNNFIIVAVPLFVFMALILEKSGVAEDLYDAIYLWFGPVRGGLAIGTLVICAMMGAMCGITGTATVTMGLIAIPSMLKRGYDKTLALGVVNSGGGWGILMPPSVDMVIYALIAQESVGKMFAGGVIPCLVLLACDSTYILIRSYFQPHIAPAIAKELRADFRTKVRSLKGLVLPIFVVFMVLGSILFGIATPTEAGALGVLGAVLSAAVNKKLKWVAIKSAAVRTLNLTSMIVWIMFAAGAYSAVFQGLGGAQVISDLIQYIPAGRWGVFFCMQVILFIMAMLMNSTSIMMITIPVFVPIIKVLGFDPLWFAVIFIVQMTIGYMTPPFGFNLFYLKSVAPEGVTMGDIYQSAIWFTAVELGGLLLIIIFPGLILWLPSVLFKF
jgi:tripartite ATP-independent transporter DctM subunit